MIIPRVVTRPRVARELVRVFLHATCRRSCTRVLSALLYTRLLQKREQVRSATRNVEQNSETVLDNRRMGILPFNMVRWYHLVLSAYGFWLPNDPRGSWSEYVHSLDLYLVGGPATKVNTKRSLAHDVHDRSLRRSTKDFLARPPVRFDDPARQSIALAFATCVHDYCFQIHACTISHDHVHVVLSRDPNRSIEQVARVLKAKATTRLSVDGTHPFRNITPSPTPWAQGHWSVFIDEARQLQSTISYVNRHALKDGTTPIAMDWIVPPDLG
jgi:REP element-mobilizing transposase RayT